MNKPTLLQQRSMQSYFGFTKLPFNKSLQSKDMFDSQSQRELMGALKLWTEVKGLALITGPSGVGKSITLRRFIRELPDKRFHVVDFGHLPTTVTGFLRLLNRSLGLPMSPFAADLFDAICKFLVSFEIEQGAHPLIVIDDAEGLSVAFLDVLRRLTCYERDAELRFSIILSSTEELLRQFRNPLLEPFRSRITYAHALRPFSIEDAQQYIHFHLQRAGADSKLFAEDAIRKIFFASQGKPRWINQLALQALIQAAMMGQDQLDGPFMDRLISAHPLYPISGGLS